MRSPGRLSTRLAVAVLWVFALAAVVGFAAEPSTSTQYDAGEGRGVFVVQHATHAAATVTARPVRLPARTVAALTTVLAGLLLVAPTARRRADVVGRWTRTVLRWATLARRGPPALALG
jgi:hypothetical protein